MPILPPDDETTLRELFPLKLVGGFIALDQHVGCFGCKWCLSRRHALCTVVVVEHTRAS